MIKNFFVTATLLVLFSLNAYSQRAVEVVETWGGQGIEINVNRLLAAQIELDCATGSVQAGRWPVNQSRINAVGTLTRQTGVALPPGRDTQRPMKTIYKANIDQTKGLMTLSIKVGNERATIYKLVKGRAGDLRRCL